MPLTWIPFIMITVFLFGIGQVFTKTGTTRLGSPGMLLLLSINMVAIYGGAWLLFHGDAPLYAKDLLSCVVATFLSAVGYIFFYEAVERQKISIVGVITAAYPLVTVILAVFFLDESLTVPQVTAIALIIASVSLLSYAPEEQEGTFRRKSWLLFAVLCFTIWGIWSVVAKYTIDTVGPVTYAGVYAVVGPAVFVPYWGIRSGKFRLTREDIPAELSVSFFCVGALFFYAALDYGYVSIVTAFSDLYPFITVFFAWIMLSEKLEMHHKIAVALALLGIVILAFV
ncbi:MAG: DMT family transporter [Theionarchaea archaeon]|nr:MAG: hypothetical protein AYK18_10710 [Theionarchaea archaeon DG-70]MBU7011563.1 DMT family transporter [Theionarchaea archaeon]